MSEIPETETPVVTVERAAEIMNKSTHSVRQLVHRKQITTKKVGRYLYLDIDSVLTYQSRKKGMPSWEENADQVQGKSFVSLEFTSSMLRVQPSYVKKLLKDELIEGYVTATGGIMISRDSVNKYLRRPDVAQSDL